MPWWLPWNRRGSEAAVSKRDEESTVTQHDEKESSNPEKLARRICRWLHSDNASATAAEVAAATAAVAAAAGVGVDGAAAAADAAAAPAAAATDAAAAAAVKDILDKHPEHITKKAVFNTYVSSIQDTSKVHKQTDRTNKGDLIKIFNTPLNYALKYCSEKVCEEFMKKFPKEDWSIFEKDENVPKNFAPIHAAAQNKSSEVLNLMFNYNIIEKKNVNMETTAGDTALHFACFAGRNANVELLLEKGAEYDHENHSKALPLHWAAAGGDEDTFETIYGKYVEKDETNHKDIIAKKYEEELLKKDKNMKQDDIEKRASEKAAKQLNKKFGEDCLKREAIDLGVPLLFAAKECKYNIINSIFDYQMEADGTWRDQECDTALHFISDQANKENRVDEITKILKANALLGVKNTVGNTPLDWISKDTMTQILDNHLQKIEFPAMTSDVSEKDRYAILFTNLFGHHASGSDVKNILALAESRNHQELALHPVCQGILSAKWQKMRKYFLIKLLFFFPFVILLSAYSILINDRNQQLANKNETMDNIDDELEQTISITWHVLYILLMIQVIFGTISVVVLIRPFMKETRAYLAHWNRRRLMRLAEFYSTELIWSDWYEYLLWIFAFLLLHEMVSPIPVVLVSWFALFIVCSNHPTILPFRYILIKILFRYLQFLIFAFGLISGFAMGFFLLLRECKGSDEGQCVNGAFTSIATTALKVPAMMMGEIDFAGFSKSETNDAFPYVYLMFGSFIFLITMCLFNMMNGLAINITHEMMQKAHIFKTIAECEMIYEFEILLTEVSRCLESLGFGRINFLSPLWVERLKASPSSGKCLNLDQKNDKNCDANIPSQFLWETNKVAKAKWIWVDRGYVLDRKIIYEAKSLISELEKNKDKNRVIYQDPAAEESSDEEDVENTEGVGGGGGMKPPLTRQGSRVSGLLGDIKLTLTTKPSDTIFKEECETNQESDSLLKKI